MKCARGVTKIHNPVQEKKLVKVMKEERWMFLFFLELRRKWVEENYFGVEEKKEGLIDL